MRTHKTPRCTANLLELCLLVMLAGYSTTTADPLIYSTEDMGAALITTDFGTGETTLIGPTLQMNAVGLAWDGTTMFSFTHGMDTAGLSQLATVDLTTGAATPYGMTNNLQFMGFIFMPDGTLYGAGATDGNLYTINVQTGVPTMVGSLGSALNVMGLALHPNGNLYGLDGFGQLFQIDPKTAQATLLVTVSGLLNPMGLGIDATGKGYTVDLLPQANVYQFDLSTGQITAKVQTTLNNLHSALIIVPRGPRLNATQQGGQLVLSWSSSCTNCVLQTTHSLGPASSWADSTTAPILSGSLYTATNSLQGAQGFFRLVER